MRAWTVSSSCSTGDARSPHRRRRRALEFSVPPMVLSDMAPGLERRVNGVGSHPKESLASLDAIEADSATLNGGGRVRKPPASPRRKPTPRQRVRWKAVQQAKLRGLSIRAIARELGIHRNTVRKYAEAKSPPMMRTRGRSRVSQSDGMTAA